MQMLPCTRFKQTVHEGRWIVKHICRVGALRGPRSEVGGQRSEDGNRKTKVGSYGTRGRWTTEIRKIED
jgi:hypothetical protein